MPSAVNYLSSHLPHEGHRETVDLVVQALNAYGLEKFDAIACRGLSGMLIAPTVAYLTGKCIIAVRKGESCHSSHKVESAFNVSDHDKRYLIVDDLVSSGDTVRRIIDEVKAKHRDFKCLAVITYDKYARHNNAEVWGSKDLPLIGVETLIRGEYKPRKPSVFDERPPVTDAPNIQSIPAQVASLRGEPVFYDPYLIADTK